MEFNEINCVHLTNCVEQRGGGAAGVSTQSQDYLALTSEGSTNEFTSKPTCSHREQQLLLSRRDRGRTLGQEEDGGPLARVRSSVFQSP